MIHIRGQALPDYYATRGWHTPNQLRDDALEAVYVATNFVGLETAQLEELRLAALRETERRSKLPSTYVKCCRCYGYHEQLQNIDQLCEICEAATAPYRYDLKHSINQKK